MSYHVSIVRTLNGELDPIEEEELEGAIAQNSHWALNKSGHVSLTRKNEVVLTLFSSQGEYWTQSPDEESLSAMISLSRKLNARVRGDELETYKSPTETYHHPDDLAEIGQAKTEAKRSTRSAKSRQWIMNLGILALFCILTLIVDRLGG